MTRFDTSGSGSDRPDPFEGVPDLDERLAAHLGPAPSRSLRNSARGIGVRLGRVSSVPRCSCGLYSTN